MKHPKTLVYTLLGAAGVMYVNVEVGSALAVLGLSIAVTHMYNGRNNKQHQQEFKAANDAQLKVFLKLGIPEDIAQASLPNDTAWELLFGKPMGDIGPIVTWLKNNKPEEFAKLDPNLRSRASAK